MADYYYNYFGAVAVQHTQSISDAIRNSLAVEATTQPYQAIFTRGAKSADIGAPTAATTIQTRNQFTNMVLIQGTMRWIYLTVALLGLTNNLVVMSVILKVKKLRKQPRNWFIFYQSMADFISAIFLVAIVFRTAVTAFSVSKV